MKTSAVFCASAFLLFSLTHDCVHAAEVTGAGSTFVFPILSKWSAAYGATTGHTVKYKSIGSGGALVEIKAARVDFGASDMPMTSDELARLGLGQFPLVIGGGAGGQYRRDRARPSEIDWTAAAGTKAGGRARLRTPSVVARDTD